MNSNHDLTRGSVFQTLTAFALPFLAANFLQALYGATDLFVVGQFSGTSAISAVNIGSQIMQLITSFVIGCSMGTTVTLGVRIGSREKEKAAQILGNSVILFAIFSLLVTPVMLWQTGNLAAMMQTPAESFQETIVYVTICSAGIPFIVVFNVVAAVLRGLGDSKTPMHIVAIACVVNIGGDLLLTGLFHMGVAGVAIATTAAQAISSFCGLWMIRRHGLPFQFSRKDIAWNGPVSKSICVVGLPIALQDTLINLSFMVLTVIANHRGLVASSAVGVGERLIMFMFLVPSSMLSAISAITAQNIGANRPERAVQSLKYGILITGVFGALMCMLSWLFPQTLTGIFSKDADVIAAAGEYLKTYSIDCILCAVTFCINGYLCGIGKSIYTFLHNVISIFLVRIPTAYFLSLWFPESLLPMGLASPLGSVASILMLSVIMLSLRRKERRPTEK